MMTSIAAMPVTSRPVCSEDASFLQAVYLSARAEEFAGLGWSPMQQEAFLAMQYRAQQAAYRQQYPAAERRILLLDGQPVGQYLVDRTPEAIHLVDVALLPHARNAGIGGDLLRRLRGEAARMELPLRLAVARENRARRLYERQGFVITGETGTHFMMEWRSAPHRSL
ncbi:MAG: GNAT family N-acetyltransferase [Blastocatellia bacterium]|nr:GNAT family N-acetyltransferase [Blastocatellia bacterium]